MSLLKVVYKAKPWRALVGRKNWQKNQTKKDFFGLLKRQKIETETVLKVSSKGKDKKAA